MAWNDRLQPLAGLQGALATVRAELSSLGERADDAANKASESSEACSQALGRLQQALVRVEATLSDLHRLLLDSGPPASAPPVPERCVLSAAAEPADGSPVRPDSAVELPQSEEPDRPDLSPQEQSSTEDAPSPEPTFELFVRQTVQSIEVDLPAPLEPVRRREMERLSAPLLALARAVEAAAQSLPDCSGSLREVFVPLIRRCQDLEATLGYAPDQVAGLLMRRLIADRPELAGSPVRFAVEEPNSSELAALILRLLEQLLLAVRFPDALLSSPAVRQELMGMHDQIHVLVANPAAVAGQSGKPDPARVRAAHEQLSLLTRSLRDALAAWAISVVEPARGTRIDPATTRSIRVEPRADLGPDTIVKALRCGYVDQRTGQTLRRAEVVTSGT
jgi:hypothetical protein